MRPWDEFDDLADRKPLERVVQEAAAMAMALLWVRLLWMWRAGVIRSEAFFGSAAWNLAICAPGLGRLGWWLLSSFRRRRALAGRLRPLTSRDPLATWRRRIARSDWWLELGIGRNVAPLVREITNRYATLDAESRSAVRALWRAYRSFAEVAGLREEPAGVDAVRRALFLYSIRDLRPDARDEAVGLDALARSARREGLEFAALAREAAMLSDDQGRDAMFGSIRELLLQYAEPTSPTTAR